MAGHGIRLVRDHRGEPGNRDRPVTRRATALAVALLLAGAACGSSDPAADTSTESDPSPSSTDVGGADAGTEESDGTGGNAADGEIILGPASITIEPEGRTVEVTGECSIAPIEFNAGVVDDATEEGVEVTITLDNTQTEPDSDFAINVTAATSVREDGTFNAQSRGGLDNQSVSYRGDGSATIIAEDGLVGLVQVVFTLTQNGPVTDPTGPPTFDDQPAERIITGELPCTIGIG